MFVCYNSGMLNINDRVVSEFNNRGTVCEIAQDTVVVKWDGFGEPCTLSRSYVENLERVKVAEIEPLETSYRDSGRERFGSD